MKRVLVMMAAVCAVLVLSAAHAYALDIVVSPKTIVLSSLGGKVTIHTDIQASLVVGVAVTVDGVAIPVRTYADDCGDLVAQCAREVVKEVIGDFSGETTTATFTLTAETLAGTTSGSDTVRVKK